MKKNRKVFQGRRKNPKPLGKERQRFTERDCVNAFVEELKNSYGDNMYIEIDQDSPARIFKSGYDFLTLTKQGVVFYEAKKSFRIPLLDPWETLTSFQHLTAQQIILAGGIYHGIEFYEPLGAKKIKTILCRTFNKLELSPWVAIKNLDGTI